MARILALLGLALCGHPLLAAGVGPTTKPPADPCPRHEAQNYAQQLSHTVQEITQSYVREVKREDLYAAALTGLYDALRLPVPSSLRADLEKAESAQAQLELVVRIRESLGNPERLRGTEALMISYRALTQALDPYSKVIDPEELRRGTGDARNFGVGMTLVSAGKGALRVEAVVPGGPGQKGGARPGDLITAIDGKPVEDVRLVELQGVPGDGRTQTFKLTVQRAGEDAPRSLSVTRGQFTPEHVHGVRRKDDSTWDHWIDSDRKIAQIRISQLGAGTAAKLLEVVSGLKNDGMKGLILDLRWCPGGFLNEAVGVAQVFLKDAVVAKVHYRNRDQDEEYRAQGNGLTDIPLIVLINEETLGGAELIAAAIQDNGRGKIAGQRSFGKASVQTITYLPVNGAGMRLTTGTFLRPNGKDLHRQPASKLSDDWGVRPDEKLACPITPDLSAKLREWWLLQILRPAKSKEALPLDDPDLDAQRNQALKALLEMIGK